MLLLTLANEPTINKFLRKRFSTKEIYTVQMAIDLLQDHQIQAIITSEFMGDEDYILGAIAAIRKASPVKIVYIGREITEKLGQALLGAGVLILEGAFNEEQLVAMIEQFYNDDAVRRFAVSPVAAADEGIGRTAYIRQRIISFVGAPGAGKSVIANSLARVIAASGVQTLLVDVANFPLQQVYFPIKDKYLTKNLNLYGVNSLAKLQDHLVEVANNLFLLPGAVTTWGEPKISPLRMNKLIQEAKDKFDVIIFDCSPFINEEATDDAVRASHEVFMVTTADLPGLHNATRLFPFVPTGAYWIQNRFLELNVHHLYMTLKRKSPIVRVPEISPLDMAKALADGKAHPIMIKYANEIAKLLGIGEKQKRSLMPRFLQQFFARRRRASA